MSVMKFEPRKFQHCFWLCLFILYLKARSVCVCVCIKHEGKRRVQPVFMGSRHIVPRENRKRKSTRSKAPLS